jgi:Na+-translocating ferredoxin:NAD+ oxidoreductase RnfE subunit
MAAFVKALYTALGAFVPTLLTLCVVRGINGAFAAAIIPVIMTLIGDSFGPGPKAIQNALGRVF